MIKIGFIGAGNMGGAIALAAKETGVADIYIYDKDMDKAEALAHNAEGVTVESAKELLCCELLFLATKPNILPTVAKELGDGFSGTIVSMAAGVPLFRLTELFGELPIIRIMPNTPVAVGKGTVVYAKNELVSGEASDKFLAVMAKAGLVEELAEELMDAETAVAGCGPAFVYMFAEAMAEGGVRAGLDRVSAEKYAASVIEGAARMLAVDKRSPKELCRAVCSPGGSTIEGVRVLEAEEFFETVASAVTASFEKTKALGK